MLVRTIPWSAESAFAELQQRSAELAAVSAESNEADTRLKMLDLILFDVLDWEKTDVDVEQYCRAVGYADYIFSIQKTVALVIEAKRVGTDFVVPEAVFAPNPVAFALLDKESPTPGRHCGKRSAMPRA